MEYVLFVYGFILLGIGGDFLIKGAIDLSLKYKIPKIIIGMTIVAFLTSLPEIIVCINAAFKDSTDLTIGNIVGSNIANLSLVIGITSLFYHIKIKEISKKFITPFLMIITIIFSYLLISQPKITSLVGIIFITTLIIFNILLIKRTKTKTEENIINDDSSSVLKIISILIIGGSALHFGAELAVDYGGEIAKSLGVSEKIMAVTLFALGTSLPEIFACTTAAKKQELSLVVGNLLGSNIFNILAAIGITSVLKEIEIKDDFSTDVVFMLSISILFYIFLQIGKQKNIISKSEGILLLGLYIIYIYITLLN